MGGEKAEEEGEKKEKRKRKEREEEKRRESLMIPIYVVPRTHNRIWSWSDSSLL
jgi:hypothetical protein